MPRSNQQFTPRNETEAGNLSKQPDGDEVMEEEVPEEGYGASILRVIESVNVKCTH